MNSAPLTLRQFFANLGFSVLINRASPYDANKFISAIFICVSRQRQLDLQTVSH